MPLLQYMSGSNERQPDRSRGSRFVKKSFVVSSLTLEFTTLFLV